MYTNTPADDVPSVYPSCRQCDSQVSRQFARVFGNNDDVVFACPNCASMADLPELASGTQTHQSPPTNE